VPSLERLAQLLTTLVQRAPDLDEELTESAATAALLAAGGNAGHRADLALLALACERVIDEVAAGHVAQGLALPALVMSAQTMVQAAASPRERYAGALHAARFEIETLLPLPDAPAPPGFVSLHRLAPRRDQPEGRRALRLRRLVESLPPAAPGVTSLMALRERYDS
jgi:ABC-type transporter Mla subunit MlaD